MYAALACKGVGARSSHHPLFDPQGRALAILKTMAYQRVETLRDAFEAALADASEVSAIHYCLYLV